MSIFFCGTVFFRLRISRTKKPDYPQITRLFPLKKTVVQPPYTFEQNTMRFTHNTLTKRKFF